MVKTSRSNELPLMREARWRPSRVPFEMSVTLPPCLTPPMLRDSGLRSNLVVAVNTAVFIAVKEGLFGAYLWGTNGSFRTRYCIDWSSMKKYGWFALFHVISFSLQSDERNNSQTTSVLW